VTAVSLSSNGGECRDKRKHYIKAMSYIHFLKQPPAVFPKLFCLQTTDSHILAPVNIECQDDRYSKLDIYISKLILDSYEYIPVAYAKMRCMI